MNDKNDPYTHLQSNGKNPIEEYYDLKQRLCLTEEERANYELLMCQRNKPVRVAFLPEAAALRKELRAFLEEYNISQEEFGKTAGFNGKQISVFLNGHANFSTERRVQIKSAMAKIKAQQIKLESVMSWHEIIKQLKRIQEQLNVTVGCLAAMIEISKPFLIRILSGYEPKLVYKVKLENFVRRYYAEDIHKAQA